MNLSARKLLMLVASFGVLMTCVLLLAARGGSKQLASHMGTASSVAEKPKSGVQLEASIIASIASCKRAVSSARTISVAARDELRFVCNKVVDRTGKEAQELRQLVCDEVAHASRSNAALALDRVRRECEVEAAK